LTLYGERKHGKGGSAGSKGLTTLCACIVWALISVAHSAWGKLLIDLQNPDLVRMPIAIPEFVCAQPASLNTSELSGILRNDLYLTGLFNIIPLPPSGNPKTEPDPDFEAWSRSGAQALVTASFRISGDEMILEAKLYDVALKKMELGKRIVGKLHDHRLLVHRFADRIMERLTGFPGSFTSRIAFVAAGQSREIFSMDFDGYDLREVIRTGSINLSPEWSPDGRSVLFTSYINGKPDLWSFDLYGPSRRVVSARPGLNASARYSPDGGLIALSMNFKGIPKIFLITPQGHIIKRLTDGRGNDISPTWSPDRSTIAYVSDQAGTPQIYTIAVEGGEPRRLTFDANYSTDPDWSPRGDLVAFTARIGGRFQVCTIRADGTDCRVLTDKGSNQDPAWSPDGRMIAFSSDRDGMRRIYIMDARGEIQIPVSRIAGKAPAWCRALR
jgi:TolB protein